MNKVALPSLSAVFLILFGCAVLYSSIYSLNRSLTNQAASRLCAQEWYWGTDILPDHPLYSALMVKDKFSLWITPAQAQPEKRFAYAQKRFAAAAELAKKGNLPLAISTLSKSQQYVLDAAAQARANNYDGSSAAFTYQQLDSSLFKLSSFIEEYPEANTPLVQSLANASKAELMILQDLASRENRPKVL